MQNDNYIVIQGWMINELKLKGNELMAFALVYGFTQDGETWYQGSSKYVAETLQVSRPTAIKVLDSLVSKCYLIKKQEKINDVVFNRYKANLQVVKKLYRGSKETLQGGSKETLQGGSKETLHSNTNKRNTNIVNTKEKRYFDGDLLNEKYKDFLEYRKEIKKPLKSERSIKANAKQLEKLATDGLGIFNEGIAIDIIDQTIANGWQGLFPLKEKQVQKNNYSVGIDWEKV